MGKTHSSEVALFFNPISYVRFGNISQDFKLFIPRYYQNIKVGIHCVCHVLGRKHLSFNG